jgi:DNA polymerase-1
VRVLDTFTEFRNLTNRNSMKQQPASLLEALHHFQIAGIDPTAKEYMRKRILEGPPNTLTEKADILDYCETDVIALDALLPRLLQTILGNEKGLQQAVHRGRTMVAAARMEQTGTPIDVPLFAHTRSRWDDIKKALIADVDGDWHVFEDGHFRGEHFEKMLEREGWGWPRHGKSGRYDLSSDTFRDMVRIYPKVQRLRELLDELARMRLFKLTIGADGRNRTMLSAYRAATSRFQPSNSKNIWGGSMWLRGFIMAPEGHGVAYPDLSQAEIGIAAALSGDRRMMDAYYDKQDPYISFAIQAGLAPAGATKETHPVQRHACKRTVLGIGYGMGEVSLADYLGLDPDGKPYTVLFARTMLRAYNKTFHRFREWTQDNILTAQARGYMQTRMGWTMNVRGNPDDGDRVNIRTLQNFPMQANCAEILRMATCYATENGIEICAPVHDAVLLCAPLDRLDADAAKMQDCFKRASRLILPGGFELKSDAKTIQHPDRYMDEDRGAAMWNTVMGHIDGPLWTPPKRGK